MSFYVTLPSNSSMKYFPQNSLTHYITQLSSDINLTDKYEVALVEFMYPLNWKCKSDGSIVLRDRKTSIEKHYFIKYNVLDNINQVFKSLNEKFEFDGYNVKLIYDENRKRVGLSIPPDYDVEFKNQINYEFGFRASKFQGPGADKPTHIYMANESIAEQLNNIHSLFLYSDLVEAQFVGDSKNALLRHVVVEDDHEFGDYVNTTILTPHYVPLKRNSFSTIEIDIRDDTGMPIQFSSGKIIVKLHFRRIINLF